MLLESAGYTCTRAATSLRIFDVIGIGPTDVVLVQCKTLDWPSSVEKSKWSPFAISNVRRCAKN